MKASYVYSIAVGTTVLMGASAPSIAQSGNDSVALEEIVVTAQKREQTFQTLAISAAVVTDEEITRTGVTSVQDAIRLVPGVKIQNIAGTGSGRVFIRGIGTTSGDEFNSIISNGVNLNLDGVNSNNASNALSSMFDVERVEVLKGPQGTLYGASALGGVVNVITARPKQQFEGTAKVQVGNYDLRNVQAMLNVPIGDTFAIRVTGDTNKRHGYVRGPALYNIFVPPPLVATFGNTRDVAADNHGAVDSKDVRIKAQWKPTDAFTALVSYQNTHDKGTSPTWVNATDAVNGNLVCCNLAAGAPPPFATASWYENRFFDRSSETYSGEFNYDFGRVGILTFLPSHNVIHDKGQELTAAQLATAQNSQQTQDTYELRLNSAAESKMIWVAGLYSTTSDRQLQQDNGLRPPSPATTSTTYTGPVYGLYEVGRPFDTFNAYAQLTFPVTTTLRATAGARYSHNSANYAYQLYRTAHPGAATALYPNGDTVVEQSPTWTEDTSHPSVTWKAGFEYDLATQSLLYGTIATGFKSGGVQMVNTQTEIHQLTPLALGGYDNETSISYELGSKNRFLDNTLQLNGSVFYTIWKNMQLNTIVCVTPGCAPFSDPTYSTWFNAGPSTQYGLEVEGIWAMTNADRINFSMSFMHGEYGKADYDWSAPNTQNGFDGHVHLKGRAMAQTPAAAGNIGYSHTIYLGSGKLTGTLEGEYSSKYEVTHEYFFVGHQQPSYWRNNASLAYELGKLQVNAYVRNLQNKTTIQSVFPFGVQAGEPRLYGASVQMSF